MQVSRVGVVAATFLLASCQTKPLQEVGNPPSSQAKAPADSIATLSVALSGGGLRSALVSIGFLKGLHGGGVLENVSTISSVSGGGYAAYWLAQNAIAAQPDSRSFSDTFANDRFIQHVCLLARHANFVPVQSVLGAVFGPRTLPGTYGASIDRTFAAGIGAPLEFLQSLGPLTHKGLPELIWNATIVSPKPVSTEASRLELSGSYFGNMSMGFGPWGSSTTSLRSVVVASGAAVPRLLDQTISLPPTTATRTQTSRVRISDGGKSENLGAMSLLRRDFRTILVLDSEHDFEYEYEGLVELKRQLLSAGRVMETDEQSKRWSLEREIDVGLPTHVITRHNVRPTSSSNITGAASAVVYVKIGFPKSLQQDLRDDASFARGATVHKEFLEETKVDALSQCKTMSKYSGALEDWLRFSLLRYGSYAERDPFMTNSTTGISYLRSNFPQYTTFDQSYYLDQALGFLALGYFLGKEAANEAKMAPPPTNESELRERPGGWALRPCIFPLAVRTNEARRFRGRCAKPDTPMSRQLAG